MRLLFLHIFLLFAATTVAQVPSYKHYETSDGLPSNEIFSVKQSKEGYLWLGTGAGLVRYDGNTFQLFTCTKSRGSSINSLAEDKFGRIWCANFSGQVFYLSNDSLILFKPFEKRYKISFAEICIDNNNNLYVTNHNNYLFKYNLNTLQETALLDTNIKNSPHIAKNGNLLYTCLDKGTAIMLNKFNQENEIKLQTTNNTLEKASFFNSVIFINSFRNKSTLAFQRFNAFNPMPQLFVFNNGVLREHPVTKQLQSNNSYVVTAYDGDDGNLFIGTNNGLLWFSEQNGIWKLKSKFLAGISITCITKDNEGEYWIGTSKNGIYKLPDINICEFELSKIKLTSNGVNCLASNDKNILLGVNLSGEVIEMNTDNSAINKYLATEQRDAQSLHYNNLSNEFWLSQNFTFKINTTKKTVAQSSLFFTNSKGFYFRNDGAIFYQNSFSPEICFAKGNNNLRDKIKNEFETFQSNLFINSDNIYERFLLSNQRSKGIWYQENLQLLWVGFIDGVAYYENKIPIKLLDNITKEPIIANQFVETKDNQLIIATPNNGLYIIHNKKIVAHYNTANGIFSNNIKRIRLENNMLWLIAGSKAQAFNLDTKKVLLTVDEQDGLLSNELYDIEILKNMVYVASSKGIQFFPNTILTKNTIAPIALIKRFVADDSLFKDTSNIHLPYHTKNIAIHLQGIALKSNGNFTYQYRLLPSDTHWIAVSSKENIIRFSSLSFGKYVFETRVINEDGIASKNTVRLSFKINKPWWFQWWFLLISLSVLLLCSYLFYKDQLRKNQQKLKEDLARSRIEEELRKSQLASLKSQMNPHFMFNALNSIQEFIILNDKEQANIFLGKFADLMRMILEMSNKDEVSLNEEIKVLHLYLELEALRFEDKFSYEIIIQPHIDCATINLPPMLVQPYVENAIKHGLLHKQDAKKVSIYFELANENTLLCKVVDNGIGRKRSNEINALRQKKHTSFATGATQTRLELLNARRKNAIAVIYTDLQDNYKNNIGTEVLIEIPI